ncbi:hypothetical protein TcasGA2_TC033402 [Tribolium castaneum]|uniref:Uncharacterized protein n=1 Tax=Tribolium castaneum TaxID=7070 RepID=A0A139WGZ9_TRICA|nr:hypothetical protein TcasGA2_TC033402 [Tribolium castaneum]
MPDSHLLGKPLHHNTPKLKSRSGLIYIGKSPMTKQWIPESWRRKR